jgi:arsenate reductase
MAAALFNSLADPQKARAISAGTAPASEIHSEVVTAMQELGIDLRTSTPQHLTPELASQAHVLVTMGCEEACPVVPGARHEDWPIDDPKGQPIDRVRDLRDEIGRRVHALIEAEEWLRSAE